MPELLHADCGNRHATNAPCPEQLCPMCEQAHRFNECIKRPCCIDCPHREHPAAWGAPMPEQSEAQPYTPEALEEMTINAFCSQVGSKRFSATAKYIRELEEKVRDYDAALALAQARINDLKAKAAKYESEVFPAKDRVIKTLRNKVHDLERDKVKLKEIAFDRRRTNG